MNLSLIGIFIGLILLMFLAYKGQSIIWVAPVCAMVVAVLSGYNVLDAYIVDYMTGMAEYVKTWFPAFFLGAVYGKLMDRTGAARSLANKLVNALGAKWALLSVVLPCLLMTYGGISLFVVVFVIYPMGYEIYREADIPRTLLPGAIATGAFGITMTAIPGSPQIQNLIPTNYFGTTAMAAPILGIVAALVILVPSYAYLQWRINSEKAKGNGFEADVKHVEGSYDASKLPAWHWLAGILPLILVILMLNLLPKLLLDATGYDLVPNYAIVVALISGIALCLLMNLQQREIFLPAINEGAIGSMGSIMNTACAVGFGSVVKAVPGFTTLTNLLLGMGGSNALFTEAISVNLLAGATGSASGGMSIALEALGTKLLQQAELSGISAEALHRIASLSSGGLDTLPHNGAVLTLLNVSNCTHKQSYRDIAITTAIIPVVVSVILAFIWGSFGLPA